LHREELLTQLSPHEYVTLSQLAQLVQVLEAQVGIDGWVESSSDKLDSSYGVQRCIVSAHMRATHLMGCLPAAC